MGKYFGLLFVLCFFALVAGVPWLFRVRRARRMREFAAKLHLEFHSFALPQEFPAKLVSELTRSFSGPRNFVYGQYYGMRVMCCDFSRGWSGRSRQKLTAVAIDCPYTQRDSLSKRWVVGGDWQWTMAYELPLWGSAVLPVAEIPAMWDTLRNTYCQPPDPASRLDALHIHPRKPAPAALDCPLDPSRGSVLHRPATVRPGELHMALIDLLPFAYLAVLAGLATAVQRLTDRPRASDMRGFAHEHGLRWMDQDVPYDLPLSSLDAIPTWDGAHHCVSGKLNGRRVVAFDFEVGFGRGRHTKTLVAAFSPGWQPRAGSSIVRQRLRYFSDRGWVLVLTGGRFGRFRTSAIRAVWRELVGDFV